MHDDVEEIGDVRLKRERGHPTSPDQLRVDGPVGAGSDQLGLRGLGAGAGDDHQIRTQRSAGQRDVDVVGVGVECGDQRVGAADAGRFQDAVIGDVAEYGRVLEALEPGRVAVDDDQVLPGRAEVLRARPAHPAPAADDHVAAHSVYLMIHPPSFQV